MELTKKQRNKLKKQVSNEVNELFNEHMPKLIAGKPFAVKFKNYEEAVDYWVEFITGLEVIQKLNWAKFMRLRATCPEGEILLEKIKNDYIKSEKNLVVIHNLFKDFLKNENIKRQYKFAD